MGKPEVKLFKPTEKSKHRIELEQQLVVPITLQQQYLSELDKIEKECSAFLQSSSTTPTPTKGKQDTNNNAINLLFNQFIKSSSAYDQVIYIKRIESSINALNESTRSSIKPLLSLVRRASIQCLFALECRNIQIQSCLVQIINHTSKDIDTDQDQDCISHLTNFLPSHESIHQLLNIKLTTTTNNNNNNNNNNTEINTKIQELIPMHYVHSITQLTELVCAQSTLFDGPLFEDVLAMMALLMHVHLDSMELCGSIYLNEVFSDCDFTLRTLIPIFSKFQDSIAKLVQVKHASVALLLASFDRLLTSSQYPKHLITNSTYIFTELLSLDIDSQSVLYHFIPFTSTTTTTTSMPTLYMDTIYAKYPAISQIKGDNVSSSYANHFKSVYPIVNQMAIFRGLVLSRSIDLLLARISTDEEPTGTTYFLDVIYKGLCDGCHNVVDAFGRVACLEYLQLWYQVLMRLIGENQGQIEKVLFMDYQQFYTKYFPKTLDIIFCNWETTGHSSIPTHINEIFKSLLKLNSDCSSQPTTTGGGKDEFISSITCRLIDEDWSLKVLEHESATNILSYRGNFIDQLFISMVDQTIAHSIKSFMELLLDKLKKETFERLMLQGGNDSKEQAEIKAVKLCEQYWLPPLLKVLLDETYTPAALLKVINYGLPSLLKVFPQSLNSILDQLNNGSINNNASVTSTLRVSLSVLSTSRLLSIGNSTTILNNNYDLVKKSLSNEDEYLRMLGLELICLSPKMTECPTKVEIDLFKQFLTINLKSSSPYIRSRTNGILEKFWIRIRDSYAKIYREMEKKKAYDSKHPTTNNQDTSSTSTQEDQQYLTIPEFIQFISWCGSRLVLSIYPGAPYPRKMLPLDTLYSFLGIWGISSESKPATIPLLQHVQRESTLFSADNCRVVIHNLWDQYDRCRESSANILKQFPSPLPGLETEEKIKPLVHWAIRLACSPKARECDSGAHFLKIFVQKYVIPQSIAPVFNGSSTTASDLVTFKKCSSPEDAVLVTVSQIVRVLRSQVMIATNNLLDSARFAPMHGLILTLRYMILQVDMAAACKKDKDIAGRWKQMVADLIGLMFSVSKVVLRVVADIAPEGYTPKQEEGAAVNNNNNNDNSLPKSLPSGVLYDDDERLASSFATLSAQTSIEDILEQIGNTAGAAGGGENEDDDNEEVDEKPQEQKTSAAVDILKGSTGQIITVCAWLSMKELSLLLGAILDGVSFPAKTAAEDSNNSSSNNIELISVQQIKDIGSAFLHILLNTRHKGAIEKAYLGFEILCSRLMGTTHPELYTLPSSWIDQLFRRVREQSLNITRRSAGLPYTFTGLLAGESHHQKRMIGPLLNQVLQSLLKLANGEEGTVPSPQDDGSIAPEQWAERNIYLPQVHSINILRSIFRNSSITNEVDSYFAQTLITIIKAYSSKSWSVRNAATMAFSTMVDKLVGVKRVREESSVLNTTTFHYFFSHLPSVHPFLLGHFKRSLESMDGSAEGRVLQSSIYAILVLFSRLQPSTMTIPTDSLSPAPFVPYISKCCTFSNFMVRQIAARALVPFIPTPQVISFVQDIVDKLNTQAKSQEEKKDYNQMHGILLQMYHLVKDHLPNFAATTDRVAFAKQALQIVKSLDWILEARIAPLAYLIYQTILEIYKCFAKSDDGSQSCEKEYFEKIVKLACQVIERDNGNDPSTFVEPPLYSAYIQSIGDIILFNITQSIQHQHKESSDLILSLLKHRQYDLRLNTTRYLMDHYKEVLPKIDCLALQSVILSMVRNEPNLPCRKQAMRLLPLINLPIPNSTELTDFIIQNVFGHCGIKKDSIVLFGHYFKQLFVGTNAPSDSPYYNTWTKIMQTFTQSDQPFELRLAVSKALESISSSNIYLEKNNDRLDTVIVEMWLTMAKLLEDDDETIRVMTAVNASVLLHNLEQSTMTSTSKTSIIYDSPKSMELVYEHLSAKYAGNLYLLSRLFEILGITKTHTQKDKESEIFNQEFKSERVLFDKEEENYYEEKVLNYQLASYHLAKILGNYGETDTNQLLTIQFEKSIKYAEWIKRAFDNNKQSVWNMWLLYNQDIFLPLYKSLLAILALSHKQPLASTTQELLNNTITTIKKNLESVNIHPIINQSIQKITNLGKESINVDTFFLTSI
ncbi:hypothetical protein DFA_03945 [Cavenderia fasciculata]|uniref:DUF2428 domain-containing protein n=1 Tax=Cavenderia fasciculata TaxID=261658 RepID=F4Q0V0_CACFS|nr:uncharacterized protein DFA_03945 [Cavenderia fasciculata]EGG18451.1 hypothetical protein DFA_03945 [Cavenderia fasciculata]|eukprot:XP_004366355.1 hypothetical protein DFA_03945 [Cavenderia fasciculata]